MKFVVIAKLKDRYILGADNGQITDGPLEFVEENPDLFTGEGCPLLTSTEQQRVLVNDGFVDVETVDLQRYAFMEEVPQLVDLEYPLQFAAQLSIPIVYLRAGYCKSLNMWIVNARDAERLRAIGAVEQ